MLRRDVLEQTLRPARQLEQILRDRWDRLQAAAPDAFVDARGEFRRLLVDLVHSFEEDLAHGAPADEVLECLEVTARELEALERMDRGELLPRGSVVMSGQNLDGDRHAGAPTWRRGES